LEFGGESHGGWVSIGTSLGGLETDEAERRGRSKEGRWFRVCGI